MTALQWVRFMESSAQLIGIDTNVLARYLVQDDQQQAAQASAFLESLNAHKKGYISVIVLIELIWLLRRVYNQSRSQVAMILDELLAIDTLVFEHQALVLQALAIYHTMSSDFSDLLIHKINQQQGCVYTVTFDKGAVNKAGMTKLQ